MKHILFVCTGNTCRSSMVEGIFKQALEKDRELKGKFEVSSAGIDAFEGEPASKESIKVLKGNMGIDISSHKARKLTKDRLKKADLVLTMTRSHRDMIISVFSWVEGKVFTLKEYIQDEVRNTKLSEYDFGLDILDPYGMSFEIYKKCGEEIKDAVEKLIIKIKIEL